jgi:hypothetical protein
MSHRPHGYARYKLDGCRCYVCGYANALYNDRRTHAINQGAWQPYTDAEPVRQHIRDLQACGLGLRTIAAAASTDRKRLQAILNGRPERGTPPQARLRPAIADAILAVEPNPNLLPDRIIIDGTGTQRRLQALVTIGWSQAKLAERIGWARPNFTTLISDGPVTAATARLVATLYDDLWDQTPPDEDRRDRGAATRARNYAAARNWAPPMAWDDDTIDDPAATPDLGAKTLRSVALYENSEELLQQNYTLQQAAERLGVTRGALEHARSRGRERVPA